MASLNKVLLMGNLTHDPEMRYAAGGGREGGGGGVCKLRLAVNRKWRNQAGEMQEEVLYVDVTAFGRQAETCGEYLRKGRPVFVEGRLRLNEWQDRESGQKRSRIEVVAENVQFLGGRDSGGAMARDDAGPRAIRDEVPATAGPAPARGISKPAESVGEEINFDDIPF